MEISQIFINVGALRSSFCVYSLASSNVTVKDIYKWRADSAHTFSSFTLQLDGGKVQKETELGRHRRESSDRIWSLVSRDTRCLPKGGKLTSWQSLSVSYGCWLLDISRITVSPARVRVILIIICCRHYWSPNYILFSLFPRHIKWQTRCHLSFIPWPTANFVTTKKYSTSPMTSLKTLFPKTYICILWNGFFCHICFGVKVS